VVVRLVVIVRVLTAVPPDDSVKGFWLPVTVMKPKGAVNVRLTVPAYPFMLVTVIVVMLLDPKMLTMLDGEEVIAKS
jgi:hypothetical protein